jgi:hypothetical protein
MTAATLINATANAILAASALHLVFRVFGHPDSAIWKKPWAAVLCKAATTVTVCGALWNVLTLSTPAPSETCLNIGVSLNFIWISYYLKNDSSTRTRDSKPASTLPRRNTSRRAANPRKRKASSSTRRD